MASPPRPGSPPPVRRRSAATTAGPGTPAAPRRPRKARNRSDSALRGDFVYAALREEIRSGRLRAGDRLREVELAERLGVSRTPVREALKRLEADGLVIFAQPRGLAVARLSRAQILDLYAMREVLEGAAARLAAERAQPLEVAALEQIIAQHANVSTPQEAAIANRRLHEQIFASTHNVYLQRMMAVLSDGLALLGTTTYSVPGRIESGWKENAEIVRCIARRDGEGAEAAARRHIRNAAGVRIAMASDD